MSRPIYLDAAATTRTDPRVAEEVMRLFLEDFGNAGSRTHSYGAAANAEVSRARERVAVTLQANPDEVFFTSGATESDNIAILGLAAHGRETGLRHIVSTAIEHKAVLEPLARMSEEGFEITLVAPDRQGHVAPEDVLSAVRPDTLLVSVMHANNETGAIQPIGAIGKGLPADGPFLHVDAAQTYGRETPALRDPRIDLISISGHKVFAPKGVGALVARRRGGRRLPLRPLMVGGGQERGLRPGTQPVPLIAGLGLAAELADRERVARAEACARIREQALQALAPLSPTVHGDPERGVLPNILSVAFPGLDSEAIMVALKDYIAVSNGSACTSARYEPSHVLAAMGVPEDEINGTIRMSWTHETEIVEWGALISTLSDLRL
ncbi:MAG TPA: aminotransferase class V-fold PLP-dependent enzyme [Microvirga sp.]|jgi:cysteine desulfurase